MKPGFQHNVLRSLETALTSVRRKCPFDDRGTVRAVAAASPSISIHTSPVHATRLRFLRTLSVINKLHIITIY